MCILFFEFAKVALLESYDLLELPIPNASGTATLATVRRH